VLGTVDYLAPEQSIDSHRVSPKVDIYSLGCTLYFLLSGRPPFPTGTLQQRVLKHRTQEPESLLNLRPDASLTLVAICQKMMAKSPDDRFASADEVVEVLQNWLDGKSSRILSLSALRLKRPKGKSQQGTEEDAYDEELTLAPIDEEIKELAAKAAVEEKSISKAKSAAGKSTDLEPVSAESAPWVPELLEELSTNEGIPTRVPMAHSTVVLGTMQTKKQGPPLGVLIAAGVGAVVVLALLIWVAVSVMP
jgi:serine/threonine protein kinase